MIKSKVGAEPKKRIKHLFCEREGIHEGIHRDEPGWFKSKYNPYCFGYGYFFQRSETLGKKLTPDYIKDNWDTEMWCRGIKESCIAVIDRKRKIAVVNITKQRCYDVLYSIPADYKIYKVNDIMIFLILEDIKNLLKPIFVILLINIFKIIVLIIKCLIA